MQLMSNNIQAFPVQKGNQLSRKVVGQYELLRTIGEGSFAKVKLAVHRLTNQKVAVKIIDKSKITDEYVKANYAREAKIMKLLHHPNIIQLYEIIETKHELFLVLEYASGGEVLDYLVAHGRVKEAEAKRFVKQVVSALEFCHSAGIVHRDLKAENLLLDDNMNVKISDFGLSNFYRCASLMNTCCGSPIYSAPELIEGKMYDGPAADAWSLGVNIYTMVVGDLPFEDENVNSLYDSIRKAKYTLPDYLSPECRDLITKLLQVDPSKRYRCVDVRNHPWLHDVQSSLDLRRPVQNAFFLRPRRIDDLDMDIVDQLESLGFDRSAIITSVLESKFDSIAGSYYLMQRQKHTEEQQTRARKDETINPKLSRSFTNFADKSDDQHAHVDYPFLSLKVKVEDTDRDKGSRKTLINHDDIHDMGHPSCHMQNEPRSQHPLHLTPISKIVSISTSISTMDIDKGKPSGSLLAHDSDATLTTNDGKRSSLSLRSPTDDDDKKSTISISTVNQYKSALEMNVPTDPFFKFNEEAATMKAFTALDNRPHNHQTNVRITAGNAKSYQPNHTSPLGLPSLTSQNSSILPEMRQPTANLVPNISIVVDAGSTLDLSGKDERRDNRRETDSVSSTSTVTQSTTSSAACFPVASKAASQSNNQSATAEPPHAPLSLPPVSRPRSSTLLADVSSTPLTALDKDESPRRSRRATICAGADSPSVVESALLRKTEIELQNTLPSSMNVPCIRNSPMFDHEDVKQRSRRNTICSPPRLPSKVENELNVSRTTKPSQKPQVSDVSDGKQKNLSTSLPASSNKSTKARTATSTDTNTSCRTMRFALNCSTTSSLPPQTMLLRLTQVLLSKNITYFKPVAMECATYFLICETGTIKFEVEICKLPRLNLHGIRMKRIQGDPFQYKKLCREITDMLKI